MYSKEFCKIYNEYGWDYFSLTMGKAILDYFSQSKLIIKNHLDLACGTGTLCDFFYKHGINTTGVDISDEMINISKKKNNKVNFLLSDILNYKSNNKYDLVTLTSDVINHILEAKNIEKLLSNIFDMLNDDGYLIFDIYDNKKLKLNKEIISNRDNGIKVYYYITENNDLINTKATIKKDDNLVYEYSVIEKLYDIEFIKKSLCKYNYEIIKIDNKITNEKQRFEDKLYIICKKSNNGEV